VGRDEDEERFCHLQKRLLRRLKRDKNFRHMRCQDFRCCQGASDEHTVKGLESEQRRRAKKTAENCACIENPLSMLGDAQIESLLMAEKLEDFLLVLDRTDNVAVLKRPIKKGTELTGPSASFTATRDIPAGHKIALTNIPAGQAVRKYGQIIGFAHCPIAAGDHVHTHNVAVKDFGRDYQFCSSCGPCNFILPTRCAHSRASPGPVAGLAPATIWPLFQA
jgi:hypothetical protein